jgi:hypothetical protein
VKDFFYRRGVAKAAARLAKVASKPEMGDAMFTTISSATGDEGRTRMRSNENPQQQAGTHWAEHDRHNVRDPANEAYVPRVGVSQSLNSKLAELDYDALVESSPVPVQPHKDIADAAFLGQKVKGLPSPSILTNPENKNLNLLAHEIGHAQFNDNSLGEVLQHPGARLPGYLAPFVAAAAGRYLPSAKAKMLGVSAATLMTAPTLIGEGVADYKGYQHLKQLGASDEELSQYVKDLLPSQASYLAMPALTMAGGALGGVGAKLAAYKLHGRRKFRNLNISIENRKGSTRSWYDPHEDRHGTTVQKYPYGYIRMTEGMDGDHVDCYVGPHEKAKNVYVILTSKPPDFKEIDEQKCMLGFSSATAARKAFAQHYDKPGFFRSMKAIPYEDFERKVLATLHGKQKKVAAETSDPRFRQDGLEWKDPEDRVWLFHGTPHENEASIDAKGIQSNPKGSIKGLAKSPEVKAKEKTHFFVSPQLDYAAHYGIDEEDPEIPPLVYGIPVTEDQLVKLPYVGPEGKFEGYEAMGLSFMHPAVSPDQLVKVPGAIADKAMSDAGKSWWDARRKKQASNRFQSDDDRLVDPSPGPTHNQVPGDHLGLPHSSLVGMRSIKGGHPEDAGDAIDRAFRFHDNPMSSRVLEGNSGVLPESPGV